MGSCTGIHEIDEPNRGMPFRELHFLLGQPRMRRPNCGNLLLGSLLTIPFRSPRRIIQAQSFYLRPQKCKLELSSPRSSNPPLIVVPSYCVYQPSR